MTGVEIPLPWERLLWSGRSLSISFIRARYVLTDFRLVSLGSSSSSEITLDDIGDVRRTRTPLDRLTGRSTLTVHARDPRRPPLILRHIRRGEQMAALLELLAADPHQKPDADVVRAALSSTPWRSRPWRARRASARDLNYRDALIGIAACGVAVFGVAIGLHGHEAPVAYPADDAIRPGGVTRSPAEIVDFMETDVMPWAETALAPIVGKGRVTCQTCHGADPAARLWAMPGVAALPNTDVVDDGWERYASSLDSQMRNAIYGYAAESDNQARAAYMREVVMPGMARLLHRPAYDFTKTYDFNRTRAAFGCYHCHRVQ